MALKESSVEQIADLLRDTATTETKACLLIGAGVSRSAGIGLAGDFIERIKQKYPAIYKKACLACADGAQPTYAQCMAALTPAKQVELVRTDIDAAKINWAHVGIARMERGRIVDTILTPNFDPLASRACALFNRFPAIYDLAGLRDDDQRQIDFDRSFVKGSAIFHLHGQHTGFLLLNTTEKLERQAKRIRPVLDAVMKGKPVIIAGYSGENDPLIDQIAALAPFNHGLFWVCHDDADPAANVRDKLLSLDDCSVVRNMPGDKFFTELANALELEAPGFLATPFDHMLSVLETLRPFSDVNDRAGDDLLAQAIGQLENAQEAQAQARPEQANIASLIASGQYDEVWDRYGDDPSALPDADQDWVAWAAIMIGNALSDQAKIVDGEAADALFALAGEKYAAALAIKPDKHEALHNWGNALSDQAKTKDGEAADLLFAAACEKYAAALSIKPDKCEAFIGWGVALAGQARTKEGEAADTLFATAEEKYAAALAINPDKYGAHYNWGNVLLDRAKTKGAAANALLASAAEKYAGALAIKPDEPEALIGWGVTLSGQARNKKDEAADALFVAAGEKYAAALAIRPDDDLALYNWGNALTAQAATKKGEAADALFTAAGEKFASALAIKPNQPEAFGNWGNALLVQSNMKEGGAVDDLRAQAREKLLQAEKLAPGTGAYDLACLHALEDDPAGAAEWLRKSHQSSEHFPGCEHIHADKDFDAIRDTPEFKQALADIGC